MAFQVVLNVASVEKSAEWYAGLGFRVKDATMEGVRYATVTGEGATLLLFPKDSPWADAELRRWLSGEIGAGVVLDFETTRLDRTWERAKRMRAHVEGPLEDYPWGQRGFMLNDPDGYVVHFMERTKARRAAKPRAKARKAATKKARPAKKAKATKKAAKRRR